MSTRKAKPPSGTVGTQHSQDFNVCAKQLAERRKQLKEMIKVFNGHKSTVTSSKKVKSDFLLQRQTCVDNTMIKGAIKITDEFEAVVDDNADMYPGVNPAIQEMMMWLWNETVAAKNMSVAEAKVFEATAQLNVDLIIEAWRSMQQFGPVNEGVRVSWAACVSLRL
jgi:hypothetical protein